MIGTSVSHYRILSKLGTGGMGEVYAAEDQHLGRRVAIKFPFPRDEEGNFRRRFQHEARSASRLTHPNIARVYDYGEAPDGRPFLVMELVDGTPLADILRRGPLEPSQASAIVAGVLHALAEAHAHGLVHRDIKPGNVMLDVRGEVKVLDFGLAKQVTKAPPVQEAPKTDTTTITISEVTVPGLVAGTPAYMSPEQAIGAAVDERSDLFSTGLLLYQCLTGIAPFSGRTSREVLNLLLNTDPLPASVRVPGLDKRWDRVLSKALQKDAEKRYRSAAEMLAGIEAVEAPPDRSHLRSLMVALVGSKRRAVSTGFGAAGLVLIAILVLLAGRPHKPPAEAARFYERGAVALRDGTYYAAARALQKAIELDPDFALAHARLAEAASELDDSSRANNEMLSALPRGSASRPGGTAGLYIDAIHRTLTRDFAGAAKIYQQLAEKVPDEEKAAALVDLGRVYEKNNESEKALAAYRAALAQDTQNAAAHLRVGVILGRKRDAHYEQELDRAYALYQALSNTEGQAEVLYQRGLLLSSVDPPGARTALEKSRELAHAIPSEQQEVAATLQLSAVTYLAGDPDSAERMAAEGVERAQRSGMNYLAARGLADLGQVKLGRRDYAGAESSFRQSLEVSQRYGMRRTEARALFYLANVHQVAGPRDATLTEGARALAYFRKAGFRIEAMQCLLVLARAHRDLGNGSDAASNFEQALAAAKEISDPIRALQAEQGLASVFLYYGRWPEASDRYERAKNAALELKDTANVVRSIAGKGAVLWRLGRYAEAERTLDEASSLVPKAPARDTLEQLLLQKRAEMALSRGQYAEAVSLARRVIESKTAIAQELASARCLTGVAISAAGRKQEGRKLCESAVTALAPMGDRFALSESRLWLAEVLLGQGEGAAARNTIDMVANAAEAVKDPELGWRAWALRARALKQSRDETSARQAAQKALQLLAELNWDAASLQGYLGRPDIGPLQREILGLGK